MNSPFLNGTIHTARTHLIVWIFNTYPIYTYSLCEATVGLSIKDEGKKLRRTQRLLKAHERRKEHTKQLEGRLRKFRGQVSRSGSCTGATADQDGKQEADSDTIFSRDICGERSY